MDLHSKMTMYITSTMTSPVTNTTKTSKWLRLESIIGSVYIYHLCCCLVVVVVVVSY